LSCGVERGLSNGRRDRRATSVGDDPILGPLLAGVVDRPDGADGYAALADAAAAVADTEGQARARVASLLIEQPSLSAAQQVRLRELADLPGSDLLPLLWRFADEQGRYAFDDEVERLVARDDAGLPEARRVGYLRYLFRGNPVGTPSLPHVVNGMPKSASTFVTGLVMDMTGLPISTPHHHNDYLGTGLDKWRMRELCVPGSVVHSHLAATPCTLCYFRLFDARPIITVRNIFDALRSYADHVAAAAGADGGSETWLNFAVMRMAGFYVEFYATWRQAQEGWDLLWVDYEQVRSDPDALIDRIAAHLGPATLSEEGIERARAMATPDGMAEDRKRLLMMNKGRSGRGREIGEPHRSLVRDLYRAYPDVDFRPIDPDL